MAKRFKAIGKKKKSKSHKTKKRLEIKRLMLEAKVKIKNKLEKVYAEKEIILRTKNCCH